MATPTSLGNVSPIAGGSGDVRTLFADNKWVDGGGAAVTLSYSFRTDASVYSTSFFTGYGNSEEPWVATWYEFNDAQKANIRAALAEWSKVANITFVEVTDSETVAGDLRFGFTDSVAAGVYAPAWAYNPDETAIAGDVWF